MIGTVKSGSLLASRYRVLRKLGKGGMSNVFEAIDTHYDRRVAIKTIRRPAGLSLLRFKEEFRSLAEMRHPNLVELYDLSRDRDAWFFSMELVEGIDLVTHFEALGGHESLSSAGRDSDGEGRPPPPGASWREVRRLLAEIASALCFLHERGLVHRDLKPSNILVDGMGRPRILDFGIAKSLQTAEEVQEALRLRKVGTPGYVAPEQIKGRALPASDIYSLGVILYRILTGRLPFRGRKRDVLVAHLSEKPRRPEDVVSGVDPYLADLAMRMLSKVPDERPTAVELTRLYRVERSLPSVELSQDEDRLVRTPFLGRETEVREVLGLLLEVTIGGPLMVCVEGPSGIGKTRLAEEVMVPARRRGMRWFRARCYEREQIPYKAFDAVADQLVGHVLSSQRQDLLLSGIGADDLAALARLFPIVADLPLEEPLPQSHSREFSLRRQSAFIAFSKLLAAVAGDSGLLLFIDDLQWADDGSFELLNFLLQQRGHCIGIMATVRPDEGNVPAWVFQREGSPVRLHHVPLEPIGREETETLVRAILPDAVGHEALADEVAAEAQGNPLVIEELVRFHRETVLAEGNLGEPLTFSDMVMRRIEALDDTARQVMQTCAAAGYALELAAIAAAVRASIQETSTVVMRLVDGRLLRRVAGREGGIRLFPFHDRATAVLLDHMEPARRRQIHRRLAAYLEEAQPDAFHALADHWRLAGVPERASTYALRAAEHAEEVQLLDRAIRYYAMALGFPPHGVEDWQIRVHLAEALDRAGRFTEAGRAFRAAARRAPRTLTNGLMLRGARALLKTGDTVTALRTMERVTTGLWGEALVQPTWRGFLDSAVELVRSRPLTQRLPFDDSPADVESAELCLELGIVVAFFLPLRGLQLTLRSLRIARRQGDPVMVARVMVALAGMLAVVGYPRAKRAARSYLGRAEALFGADRGALGLGNLHAVRALVDSFEGQWGDMRAAAERAFEAFSWEGSDRSWYVQMLRVQQVVGEVEAGDLSRAERASLELLPAGADWTDPDLQGWTRWARARVELAFSRWDVAEQLCRLGLARVSRSQDAYQPLWLRLRIALAMALAGSGTDGAARTTLERTIIALRRVPWLDPLSRAELDGGASFVYTTLSERVEGASRRELLGRAARHARRLRRSPHLLFRPRGIRWQAEIELHRGHAPLALRLSRDAVDALLASRQRLEAAHALLTQAQAEEQLGEPTAAETRKDAVSQLAAIVRPYDPSRDRPPPGTGTFT